MKVKKESINKLKLINKVSNIRHYIKFTLNLRYIKVKKNSINKMMWYIKLVLNLRHIEMKWLEKMLSFLNCSIIRDISFIYKNITN